MSGEGRSRGSGLAGELADPLAEVEDELEHGGSQALVDQVPGQATLRGDDEHGAGHQGSTEASPGSGLAPHPIPVPPARAEGCASTAAGSCRFPGAGSGGGTEKRFNFPKKALHDSTPTASARALLCEMHKKPSPRLCGGREPRQRWEQCGSRGREGVLGTGSSGREGRPPVLGGQGPPPGMGVLQQGGGRDLSPQQVFSVAGERSSTHPGAVSDELWGEAPSRPLTLARFSPSGAGRDEPCAINTSPGPKEMARQRSRGAWAPAEPFGKMLEAADRRVINSSAATAFLAAAEAGRGRGLSGPGSTRNVFPFRAPPRTAKWVYYPLPSRSLWRRGSSIGARSVKGNTSPGQRGTGSALPLLWLPRPFPTRVPRQAGAALLCGEGGPWEGRGPQLCSRALMNGAFVLAAAAPLPRQPSAEEETEPAPLPASARARLPPSTAFCLGQQQGRDTQLRKRPQSCVTSQGRSAFPRAAVGAGHAGVRESPCSQFLGAASSQATLHMPNIFGSQRG